MTRATYTIFLLLSSSVMCCFYFGCSFGLQHGSDVCVYACASVLHPATCDELSQRTLTFAVMHVHPLYALQRLMSLLMSCCCCKLVCFNFLVEVFLGGGGGGEGGWG